MLPKLAIYTENLVFFTKNTDITIDRVTGPKTRCSRLAKILRAVNYEQEQAQQQITQIYAIQQ